jgi:predicted amidohydrolase
MHVTGDADNVPAMRAQLQTLLTRFPWIRMVVFSELAACGGALHLAQPLPGPAEAAFQEMAATHGVWLLPGSIFEKAEDGNIYNTASVIDPGGKVVAHYRKLFPFCPYETGVTAGDRFCVFDVPEVGRFGVSICYDSWFPEVARTLTALGAEVLLQPVLTDTIDRDIELSIARATAAQFQTYVVNINGVGDGGVGRSCVIDPAGYVLHQAGTAEMQIPVEIDFDLVRRQREIGIRSLGQVLKSFRDRRVDFSVYDRGSGLDASLRKLGPLRMPTKEN